MLEGRNFGKALVRVTPPADIVQLVKATPMYGLIVLLHGAATGSLFWTPISTSLAESGTCFAVPELIGYGRSPPPSSSYGIVESNSEIPDPPMEDQLS